MTTQVTATELKAQILAVLDRVAAGEEVEITKHGHTIARLIPARASSALRGCMEKVAMTAPGVSEEELFRTSVRWEIAHDA